MTDTEQEIAEQMADDEETASDDEQVAQEQGDETEGEPESEQAAPPPRSQKEIDELHEKLKKEGERHAKRVAEIMGDDFSLLVPSPIDWTPGFLFGVSGMLPSPEQMQALNQIMGEAAVGEYPDDPDRVACDVCLGTGKLKTHSLVPGEVELPCRFCQGHGWTGEGNPKIEPFRLAVVPPPAPGQPLSADTYQVKDSWGRPAGHPHFGVDPVSITA